MAKNRQVILENIELLRAGARGISIGKTSEGKTVLVSEAVPGDVVDVQIYKKKNNYLEGKAIKIKKKSEYRVEPKCSHFGICGGCKWQNLDYKAQLKLKQDEVKNNLERIGGFENLNILPILESKEEYFYRNKLEFTFSDSRWLTLDEIKSDEEITNRNALGFHIPKQWSKVLDIEKCYLQKEPSNAIRLEVKRYADENNLEYFDLVNQKGFLRTLMIRTSSTGEVMVLVQFFREDKIKREEFLNNLKQKFPEITSLLYAINSKANDSVYDLEIKNFFGEDFIIEKMENLQFRIGAKSFYQTNSEQAYELYKIVREFADLKGNELVYDLYTGTGTIAQFISEKTKKIIGIEAVSEAIEAAKENAKINEIKNCTFYCGDMKDILNEDFISENGNPDVIITDPPRDGMHKKVVENILNAKPEKIVYVSCNSATQARDLALMKEQYAIKKTQAVDMFPQTFHVENVILLERR